MKTIEDAKPVRHKRQRFTQCKIDGCKGRGSFSAIGTEIFTKGLCYAHYQKLCLYGDPLFELKRNGEQRNKHPLYRLYRGVYTRCYNTKEPSYQNYGARGIKMCERWLGLDGFTNFAKDMGPRPSLKHSIERIDNDGDYSPENCRWATIHEQSANRRTSNEIVGVSKSRIGWRASMQCGAQKWSKDFKVKEDAIIYRKDLEKKVLLITLKQAIMDGLPKKRELVYSRPLEWDNLYHVKWNATQRGYNHALDDFTNHINTIFNGRGE